MRRRKLGAIGVLLSVLVVLVALVSPVLHRYDDNRVFALPNPEFEANANPLEIAQNPKLSSPTISSRYESPSATHWFGTDQYGRDIYARVITAARVVLDPHPWAAVFSGGAITLTVLGFNLASDAIRDELDPRLRGR